ncbi:MAG: hypothetical protein ACOX1Z_03365 [Candidatus Ratteibacteria bacterium]
MHPSLLKGDGEKCKKQDLTLLILLMVRIFSNNLLPLERRVFSNNLLPLEGGGLRWGWQLKTLHPFHPHPYPLPSREREKRKRGEEGSPSRERVKEEQRRWEKCKKQDLTLLILLRGEDFLQ